MTANDPLRQQEAVNHGDAELPARNHGTRPEERALLYKFDERPKSGFMIPSRCECLTALQERFSRTSISTHEMIDHYAETEVSSSRHWHKQWHVFVADFAVLLFANGLAGLVLAQLRVPAPRGSLTLAHSTDKTPPLAWGTGSQISDKDSLSTDAWRWKRARS